MIVQGDDRKDIFRVALFAAGGQFVGGMVMAGTMVMTLFLGIL